MGSATLLGLPRELRDCIYDFVYPKDFVMVTSFKWDAETRHFGAFDPVPHVHELLQVNRQNHGEAATNFYSKVSFKGGWKI